MPHRLDLSRYSGLSEAEASRRLKDEGPNELPASRARSFVEIAWHVTREPMFVLLVACGAIYLLLGSPDEALMLLGFVVVVMGITLYQERKSERALEALRDLSSPRARVIRDGAEKRIAGREVVRGDILVVSEGDRVPADAVVLGAVNLSADESLLTGESVPVRKSAVEGTDVIPPTARPGGDDSPFLYSSTLVVNGLGIARVVETGALTEVGRIGRALATVEPESTLLQRQMAGLVRNFAAVGLSLCGMVVVVYALTRGDWLQGLLAGITLAMATLPEEFPVVLTIFLAIGAWRMSRQQVLTRRVPAIETLGAATVLCVDKTGTLTLNRMTVNRLDVERRTVDVSAGVPGGLPEEVHELVEFSILASHRDPFDPMEKAITRLGADYLAETEHLHADWELVHQYPLSKELLAISHVWRSPAGTDYAIAAKGAPEAIADLCHLDERQLGSLADRVRAMASDGLRVIGVARAEFTRASLLPNGQHDFDFELLGLVGLTDPLRPTVAASVEECRAAGIRVVMITGDYPGTAENIARQIGLGPSPTIVTGPELDARSDDELRARVREVDVFARVVPEQKLRLVNALRAAGEIVAMTGDGVNDAPALKAAHIGVAMGERGTDVAREASALVLLDDDFSSIVRAVRMGRRIFDNIKKAIAYILAVHVPIAGMSLVPVFLNLPLVLLPVHILFLELIIDPACSTVFEAEPEEAGLMTRPPRRSDQPLFGRRIVALSVLQGAGVLAIVLAVFLVGVGHGTGEDEARTLSFTTLIAANLALILTNRSWTRTIWATLRTRNTALWWVLGGATAFFLLVLSAPFLRAVFKFAPPTAGELGLCVAAGVASVAWFEALKVLGRHGVNRVGL